MSRKFVSRQIVAGVVLAAALAPSSAFASDNPCYSVKVGPVGTDPQCVADEDTHCRWIATDTTGELVRVCAG